MINDILESEMSEMSKMAEMNEMTVWTSTNFKIYRDQYLQSSISYDYDIYSNQYFQSSIFAKTTNPLLDLSQL